MPEDAVKVAPHVYKPIFENDRVRVLDTRMKPGDKTEMHGHPDVVVYAVRGSMHTEATKHATENVGTTDAHVVLVELKQAP